MDETQIKQIIERQPLHGTALLDPRCKILLLVCIGFVSYFLAGEVVSLALMLVYGLFIALGNGGKWAAKMIITYIVVAYLNALLRYVQVPVLSVIMEFIEKLPQGIHSMAGDAGKMLSGGQRQRISLARAILKDAPIVVLDEATAYADPENEEKMEAAIAELVKGKTLVVIAHKLPAIMNADQIWVIDHGKLVAAGKHQDLIRSCPEYQKLWKAAQDSAEWKVHTAKEGA